MTPIPPIPEDLRDLLAAIDSFAHHSPAVCECDLEGGDPDCKIEPKCPTPYEWQCMTSATRILELVLRIGRVEAEREALQRENEQLKAENTRLKADSAALILLLTNCRNGLDLLLQKHKPERATDPFDTINELRETVRESTKAIASRATRTPPQEGQ